MAFHAACSGISNTRLQQTDGILSDMKLVQSLPMCCEAPESATQVARAVVSAVSAFAASASPFSSFKFWPFPASRVALLPRSVLNTRHKVKPLTSAGVPERSCRIRLSRLKQLSFRVHQSKLVLIIIRASLEFLVPNRSLKVSHTSRKSWRW